MNENKAQNLVLTFVADCDDNARPSASEQVQVAAFVRFLYNNRYEIRRARKRLTNPVDRA